MSPDVNSLLLVVTDGLGRMFQLERFRWAPDAAPQSRSSSCGRLASIGCTTSALITDAVAVLSVALRYCPLRINS